MVITQAARGKSRNNIRSQQVRDPLSRPDGAGGGGPAARVCPRGGPPHGRAHVLPGLLTRGRGAEGIAGVLRWALGAQQRRRASAAAKALYGSAPSTTRATVVGSRCSRLAEVAPYHWDRGSCGLVVARRGFGLASHETRGTCAEETRMAGYSSGELVWDTAEARAPRWVLLLDGPPGVARRRLDPQERSTPQGASASQLRELIRRAFHADTGQWPVNVTLTVIKYKQRFRFQVVMS